MVKRKELREELIDGMGKQKEDVKRGLFCNILSINVSIKEALKGVIKVKNLVSLFRLLSNFYSLGIYSLVVFQNINVFK